MKFSIRPMKLADYDSVLAVWRNVEGVGLHDDCDSRKGIEQYLKCNPGTSFVAVAGKAIVGAVLSGHDGRRGYLHHLAVLEPCRGQGIGRALAGRCLDAMGKRGIPKCNIFVMRDNAAGKAFWRRVGWKQRGNLCLFQKATGT